VQQARAGSIGYAKRFGTEYRAREHPPVIRISAALILLASVVQAPPAWVATAGLCVFTIILESWELIEP
jgi:hypothetical protein